MALPSGPPISIESRAFGMSGGLSVVRDTPRSVLLRFRYGVTALFALVFAGGTWLAFTRIPDGRRWLFGSAFGFVTLLIALGSFWREELELDFATGQWRLRRGFVGGIGETRGALDEIPEVELVLDRRSSSKDDSYGWQVRIEAPRWPRAVVVARSRKEEKGYAELERWAKRLRRDAVDRTGERTVRTPWDGLDAGLTERGGTRPPDFAEAALAQAFANPVPTVAPQGSRIVVTAERGRTRIVLPAAGFNGGVVFLAVFGLFFAGMGGAFTAAALGLLEGVRVNGQIVTEPMWGAALMGSAFALIGIGTVAAPIVGAFAREWIEDRGDALVIGHEGWGTRWGLKTLPKREIEAVDLSAPPSSTAADAHELRIRADARVLRVGRRLTPEELRWLRARLEAMVRS